MGAGSDIRAGGAHVELRVKDSLTKGLNAIKARLQSFGQAVAGVGTKIMGLGLALDASLKGSAVLFASTGAELYLLSQRTGISVEELSLLKSAAGKAGVETEDLEKGIRFMNRTLAEAAEGIPGAAQDLARLGLAIGDLSGKTTSEQLGLIADRLNLIQNPAQRANAALQIFGRGATELLPLLNRGSAGIRELGEGSFAWTTDMAQRAFALQKAFEGIGKATKAISLVIGDVLAESMTRTLTQVKAWIGEASKWIGENRDLVKIVSYLALGLIGVGGALIGLGVSIKLIGAAVGFLTIPIFLVSKAFVLMAAAGAMALGSILAPLAAIAAVAAAVGVAVLAFTSQGRAALGALGDGALAVGSTFATTWQGIRDAISSGDLEGAASIALLGLQVAFRQAIASLSIAWRNFSGFFVDVWSDAVDTVAKLLIGIQDGAIMAGVGIGASAAGAEVQNPELAMIDQMAEERRRRRNQETSSANAADNAEIRRLQDEITARALELRQARELADYERAAHAPGEGGPAPPLAGLNAAAKKIDVKGTFSAFAIAGLGASSVTERIANASEQTARNTRNLRPPEFS